MSVPPVAGGFGGYAPAPSDPPKSPHRLRNRIAVTGSVLLVAGLAAAAVWQPWNRDGSPTGSPSASASSAAATPGSAHAYLDSTQPMRCVTAATAGNVTLTVENGHLGAIAAVDVAQNGQPDSRFYVLTQPEEKVAFVDADGYRRMNISALPDGGLIQDGAMPGVLLMSTGSAVNGQDKFLATMAGRTFEFDGSPGRLDVSLGTPDGPDGWTDGAVALRLTTGAEGARLAGVVVNDGDPSAVKGSC